MKTMLYCDYKKIIFVVFVLTSINGCFHDSFYGGDYYELTSTELNYIKINDVDVSTDLSVKQTGFIAELTSLISDEAVFAGNNILPDIRIGYSSEDDYLSVEFGIYNPQNDSKLTVNLYRSFFEGTEESISTNISYSRHSQLVAFINSGYPANSESDISSGISVTKDEIIIHTEALLTDVLSPLIDKYVLDQASRPIQSAGEAVTVTELKSFFSNGGVYVFNLDLGYTLTFKDVSAGRGMGCFFLAESESEKPAGADDDCREEIAYVSFDTGYTGTIPNVELNTFSINEVDLIKETEDGMQDTGLAYIGESLQPEIIIQLNELDNNDFQFLNLHFSFTDNTSNSVLNVSLDDVLLTSNALKFSSHSRVSASYAHRDINDLSIYQAERKVSINVLKETTSILEINDSGLIIHSNSLLEALRTQALTNSLNYSAVTPTVPSQFDRSSSYTYQLNVARKYGDLLTVGKCAYFAVSEGDLPENSNTDCPLQ
ncbi:MAG: hypothetical protein OEX19_00575 [Gammaproteobacteria bacterium]|nr:hypothetical protein [Gammaproteobacteria bacterium]